MQQGLGSSQLDFRMGINLGDIIDDGEDIHGEGVNVAARIEALAEPGGINISGDVYNQIRNRIQARYEDQGEHEVKNVSAPVRVYSVQMAEASTSHGAERKTVIKPSIAVLPFENMSNDPEQEYFADGMVEEIITGLSRIRWLTVIARNSTFAYKGKAPDIRQVGIELAVRYVLEGSVRKAGDRVRITAQLIEAESGGHLWADRFDGSLADIFDLQDRITAGVVAAIEPSVQRAEIERAKRKRPDSLDAYDLYLRALDQAFTFTQKGRNAALGFLDAALAFDPAYAQAHGLSAWCLQQRFLWGGSGSEDRDAALGHATAVANLRTDDATALAFAAFALSSLARDHETALPMIERALAQNPSSALAHAVRGVTEMIRGHVEDSVKHAEQSLRLSPFDPLRYIPEILIATAKLISGDCEGALERIRTGLEANPNFAPGRTILVLCLARLGRHEEAKASVKRLLEIAPDTRLANLPERFLFANTIGLEEVTNDLRSAGFPE